MQVVLLARPTLVSPLPEYTKEAKSNQLDGSCDSANLIELAGRECYDSLGSGRSSADYHKHLLEVDHGSVLEHAQFSFRLTGISRSLSHELVRHRVGVAISQRSTRYVDESESDVVPHPLFQKYATKEDLELLNKAIITNRLLYTNVFNRIKEGLVNDGVDASTANKQARGAARNHLENGLETRMVWSANVRTLRHVINMRGSKHADAEIQILAKNLLNIMVEELPEYFSDLQVDLEVIDGNKV